MSVENPLVVASEVAPDAAPAQPPPPPVPVATDERGRITNLLAIGIGLGVVLPVLSVCGIGIVPFASVLCLFFGPLIGLVLGVIVAARGDRIAARFLQVFAVVVVMADLFAALLVWGGTAAAVYYLGQRYGLF
jgi:hypothetical protein